MFPSAFLKVKEGSLIFYPAIYRVNPTISVMVTIEKSDETATIFEASRTFPLYLIENIAVMAATGAQAEIIEAIRSVPLIPIE